MIKDIFVLRKDAWHVKLMKYMWDLSYSDFTHMCPYFWISIVNVLIIVPYFIVRSLAVGIILILKKLEILTDKYIDAWIEAEEARIAANPKYAYKLAYRYFNNDKYIRIGRYGRLWDRLPWNSNLKMAYSKISEDALLKKDEEEKRWREKKINAMRRKKKINNIVKYAKPIAAVVLWVIGAAICIGGIFGIYKLILWASTLKWGVISLTFLKGVGLVIVISAIVFGIVYIIKSLTQSNKVLNFFSGVGTGISFITVKPVSSIINFIKLLIQMVKNNCPAIKWE